MAKSFTESEFVRAYHCTDDMDALCKLLNASKQSVKCTMADLIFEGVIKPKPMVNVRGRTHAPWHDVIFTVGRRGLIIPPRILKQYNWNRNDKVHVDVKANEIIVKRA